MVVRYGDTPVRSMLTIEKNSRMRLLYIRNLVKEWLKATFRLFRHTLSHKNGVKKDTEGILNIDINNFSSTFHTDDKKMIILML